MQYRKEFFTNGKIKKASYYNTKSQYTSVIKWNSRGVRTSTKEYNGKGFKTSEYTYHPNGKIKARYTYYKTGAAMYTRVDYNQKGEKTAYTKYDRKKNKLLKNTYFKNGKVSKSYQEHIAKNGVKTGITEQWYYSSGKLKKVDARTFPTYYSQYTPYYKKFSCPAYNGNMYKHGCIMNSMSMFYSIYNNDELTPVELYSQGYKCFFNVPKAFSRNGLDVDQVNVAGSKHNAYTKFYNTGGHVPNGKRTFTIEEALVNYGMPVQLMMRSNGHMAFNFPGHSIVAYRYVYENGKETIYAKNPGAKGGTVKLQSYMNGEYHEVGATYYIIKNGWVGSVK